MVEKLECENNPIDPDFESKLSTEGDEGGGTEKTLRYWYGGCNRGWRGPNRPSRAEARADANAHNARTGHGAGVMGPYG